MPTAIRFTHAAIRDLRFLDDALRERLRRVLQAIGEGTARTKKLAGYQGYWRSRSDNLRVIWRPAGDHILVARARVRAEAYRGRDWSDREAEDGDALDFDPLEADAADRDELPSDETAAYTTSEWTDRRLFRTFVQGAFRHSPHLTPTQSAVAAELTGFLQSVGGESPITLVQGGPGTGKTIACALVACSLLWEHEQARAFLIVPERLAVDIRRLREVQETSEIAGDRLVVETFEGFLQRFLRCKLSTAQQELEVLRAFRARRIDPEPTLADVALYRAFVLADASPSRNALFQQHRSRIEELRLVPPRWFHDQLRVSGLVSPSEAARQLVEKCPEAPGSSGPIVLFVDELQDRTLSELRFLRAAQISWTQRGRPTAVALMGDANQRVTPTDFQWQALAQVLGVSQTGRHRWSRNLRSTRAIAMLAGAFWRSSKSLVSDLDGRHLPAPIDPDACERDGDPVSIVRVDSASEALEFARMLARRATRHEYLRQDLSGVACLLWPLQPPEPGPFEGLLYFGGGEAKGLEFEDCAVVIDMSPRRPPTLEELNQIYTALTRPRDGLLVVITAQTPEWVWETAVKAGGIARSPGDAVGQVGHGGAGLDLERLRDDVLGRLSAGTAEGLPFLDTWELLRELGVPPRRWEDEFVLAHRGGLHANARGLIERFLRGEVAVAVGDRLRAVVTLKRALGDLAGAETTLQLARRGHVGTEELPENERTTLISDLASAVGDDWVSRGRRLAAARLIAALGEPWPSRLFPEIPTEVGGAATDLELIMQATLAMLNNQPDIGAGGTHRTE